MRNLGFVFITRNLGVYPQRPSTDFDAFRAGTPGLYSLECIPTDGSVTAADGPVVGIDPGIAKPIQADNGLFEVKVGGCAFAGLCCVPHGLVRIVSYRIDLCSSDAQECTSLVFSRSGTTGASGDARVVVMSRLRCQTPRMRAAMQVPFVAVLPHM